ncbi:MAG TPA: hypothetical protein VEX62_09505 [Candidatus Limnocylindrales bacterium]|nr:hypothetical protein [Candidatus Limnocylindrales bacterium]
MGAVAKNDQDHVRSTVTLAQADAPRQSLLITHPCLRLDADELIRDPQQQIPGSLVSGNRERHLGRHLPCIAELRPESFYQRPMATIHQTIPYWMQARPKLQPQHSRYLAQLLDGGDAQAI